MRSLSNKLIIASPGAGKTYDLVKTANISAQNGRVLITTYTLSNLSNIKKEFYKQFGSINPNVAILSWHSFLFKHCVRPFQTTLVGTPRIQGIFFLPDLVIWQKRDTYLTKTRRIYSNKLSQFAVDSNTINKGDVIEHLEKVFSNIFIDEVQDFAGYDLDFLELLYKSDIKIYAVGDPRQAIYQTNNSRRNSQYRGDSIRNWFLLKEKEHLFDLEITSISRRNNQSICNFANNLYPTYTPTIPFDIDTCLHQGVFAISPYELDEYLFRYAPQILRYSKLRNIQNNTISCMNFGVSKGKTFDHVLILPTQNMIDYLIQKKAKIVGDNAKAYVAITRARHSVTFLLSENEKRLFNQSWQHTGEACGETQLKMFNSI